MKKTSIPQIMLSLRLNERQTEKAEDLEFPKNWETSSQFQKKKKKTVETVGDKKAFRLGRTSGGKRIADGGNLLFRGFPEGKVFNISSKFTVVDLYIQGYKISKVEIFQRTNQNFGFLRIYLNVNPENEPKFHGTRKEFLDTHLSRFYNMCVGFINAASDDEPLNVTLNFGKPITDSRELEKKSADLKNLRIISSENPGLYRLDKAQ